MRGIHPGWRQGEPAQQPAPEPLFKPERKMQRCLVCKTEFMPVYHIQHQVLCGSPECKRIRHRAINRRYEQQKATQIPNDRPVSDYPGVHWRNRKKPWVAQIKVSGRQVYLGSFATEEEAAEAFTAAVETRRHNHE